MGRGSKTYASYPDWPSAPNPVLRLGPAHFDNVNLEAHARCI